MNVAREVDWTLRRFGCFDAIVCRNRVWTSVELHDAGCRVAAALVAAGLEPGGCVGVVLGTCVEHSIVFEGVLRAGGVVVPLSPKAPATLIARLLDHCAARFVVLANEAREAATSTYITGRFCVIADDDQPAPPMAGLWPWLQSHPPLRRAVRRADADPAMIQYSSGTTGTPKGVVRTHRQLLGPAAGGRPSSFAQMRATIRNARRRGRSPSRPQVVLTPLPLSHGFGGAQLFRRLYSNALVVMLDRFETQEVLATIQRYRVTQLSLVPSFAESLLAAAADVAHYDVSSLRSVVVGGAASRPGLLEALEALLQAPIENQYGMTEGGGTSTAISGTRKPGSVGRPFAGCAVRIVDAAGLEVPVGERGEVEMRVASAFSGYFGDPEATAAVLRDGWRRTGDIGYVDGDGDLFLVGRQSDLIIQGGVNISPVDVEEIVRVVPGVADAAAVAVSSAYLGDELTVCIVRAPSATVSPQEIMDACARELDASRMPVAVHFVDELPRTELGKIKRRELSERVRAARQAERETTFVADLRAQHPTTQHETISAAVQATALASLRIAHPEATTIDPQLGFAHQGLTSLGLVRVANQLAELLGRPIDAMVLFNHSTVASLATFLLDSFVAPAAESAERLVPAPTPASPRAIDEPIAIVGMACRFPGADSVEAYWRLLCDGVDATAEAPADRFPRERSGGPASAGRHTSRGAFLSAPYQLDAAFFGQSPREAARLKPAQRVLLEVTWQAIEDAAQDPSALEATTTGVYIGAMGGDAQLAGMTSYWLNVRGPSLTIDTACSASLVAVHSAVHALRLGECDVALAGGVHIIDSWQAFSGAAAMQLLSADGRCRTFDADAAGIAMGEGCGMVVLKRLADAVANGDRIVGVIRASVVNHDGRSSSLAAPNGAAQRRLFETALHKSGIAPAAVEYVEAHGTGTKLGDPIEVRALAEAFGRGRSQPLVIGSAKTNIGHTQGAAGVAGLIKAALCVERATIPPTVHFRTLNPLLQPWRDAVKVATHLQSWPEGAARRMAGVTSMGLFGTNAHALVEQPPERARDQASTDPPFVLCLSALDDERRRAQAQQLGEHLERAPADGFGDICYTSAVGRRHFAARAAIVADTPGEARALLADYAMAGTPRGVIVGDAVSRPKIVFLFTGQGSLRVGMGRGLWASEPVFRDALTRCDAILRPLIGRSVVELLYGADGADEEWLERATLAQPTLFAFEWALSRVWHEWGIQPDAVLGHSLGEYVAACVAGMLDLEAALGWVVERAGLMQVVPGQGAMAAIAAPVEQVREWLDTAPGPLDIAAINGPRSVVVSGDADAVAALMERGRAAAVDCRPLRVRSAYHSALMAPMLNEFAAVTARLALTPPRVEFISSCTGAALSSGELTTAEYWRRQVREPVQFASAIDWAVEHGYRTFVEIGPDAVLTTLGRVVAAGRDDVMWTPSLRGSHDDRRQVLTTLAALHARGATPNWEAFYRGAGHRRVALPTYPFRKQLHPWRSASPVVRRTAPAPTTGAVTAAVDASASSMAPTDRQPLDVGSTVRQLIAEVLPAPGAIADGQNLLDVGLDSLRVMDLLALTRERVRVACTPAEFLTQPTIAGFTSLLTERLSPTPAVRSGVPAPARAVVGARRGGPLAVIRPGAGAPLVCLHPAGGDIRSYLRLREIAPGDRPVFAIQSRGLDDPDREHASLETMAADYATLIEDLAFDKPCDLFGWSMGAVVAHALGGELERRGARISGIVMIDPPRLPASAIVDPCADLSLAVAGILANLRQTAGDVVAQSQRLVRRHADASAVQLYDACVAAGLIADWALSPEAFERAVRLRRRHHELIRNYRPRPVDATIQVWWAADGPPPRLDEDMSRLPIRAEQLPGNHFSVMSVTNLRQILDDSAVGLSQRSLSNGAAVDDLQPDVTTV